VTFDATQYGNASHNQVVTAKESLTGAESIFGEKRSTEIPGNLIVALIIQATKDDLGSLNQPGFIGSASAEALQFAPDLWFST